VPAKDLSVFQNLAAPAISITIGNLRAIGDLENTVYFLRLRAMATIPSPARPVTKSRTEAGSGTTDTPLAFAVAGTSIPSRIQYADFINPPYFLRRRTMATTPSPTRPVARRTNEAGSGATTEKLAFAVAGKSSPNIQYTDFIRASYFLRRRPKATIPSPAKPVARSTNEAGSGTVVIGTLAFAVAGKSMAATIQYTNFINPPCRSGERHYTWRHDSYHECKILKTNLLFYCDKERGCGTVKISYTQVMPSFVKKAYLLRV
jgi:hypothetical protein